MKKLVSSPRFFNKILNLGGEGSFWATAAISLVLIGFSYGLYTPSLGYYFDDWPQLYSMITGGLEGIKQYYLFDSRPFCFWPEWVLFRFFGTNAILWHISNYLLHWGVGLSIYFALKSIWQKSNHLIQWTVLLFAVYPLFDQQSLALVYIGPRVSYLLFFISIGLMVKSARTERNRLVFLLLSLLVNAINLFTVEYFLGLELLRPPLFWLIHKNHPKLLRLKKTIIGWLPYLALLLGFVFWRMVLVVNLRGLSLSLITLFHNNPLDALRTLVEFVLRDLLAIVITVWYPAIETVIIDFSSPVRTIQLGLIILIFAIFSFFYFFQWKDRKDDNDLSETQQGILLGFLGVISSCVPFWVILRSYSETSNVYVDRFGFPGMWAASLLIVSVLTKILAKNLQIRNLILLLLVSFAVGHNFYNSNSYKWSTIWQHRIFSQLKWRAPAVQPNTLFLSDVELFSNMGVYPTAFALNLLYEDYEFPSDLEYYYLTISKYYPTQVNDLQAGIEVNQRRWFTQFIGNTSRSLVIHWPRKAENCLWVLSSNDRYNPLIPQLTRQALPASNLSVISNPTTAKEIVPSLFGDEDRNSWCFFYEKADLARQSNDWETAINLYEESSSLGFSPANGVELIPFIEAYAYTGRADLAADLTSLAKDLTPDMRNYLCDTWNRMARDVVGDNLFNLEYQTISAQDLCWEVQ